MQQMGYMTQPFLAGQYPTAMVRYIYVLYFYEGHYPKQKQKYAKSKQKHCIC